MCSAVAISCPDTISKDRLRCSRSCPIRHCLLSSSLLPTCARAARSCYLMMCTRTAAASACRSEGTHCTRSTSTASRKCKYERSRQQYSLNLFVCRAGSQNPNMSKRCLVTCARVQLQIPERSADPLPRLSNCRTRPYTSALLAALQISTLEIYVQQRAIFG